MTHSINFVLSLFLTIPHILIFKELWEERIQSCFFEHHLEHSLMSRKPLVTSDSKNHRQTLEQNSNSLTLSFLFITFQCFSTCLSLKKNFSSTFRGSCYYFSLVVMRVIIHAYYSFLGLVISSPLYDMFVMRKQIFTCEQTRLAI